MWLLLLLFFVVCLMAHFFHVLVILADGFGVQNSPKIHIEYDVLKQKHI